MKSEVLKGDELTGKSINQLLRYDDFWLIKLKGMRAWICISVIVFVVGVSSCSHSQTNPQITASSIREKYKFTFISVKEHPASAFSNIYVPFLENGKYFISNYEGRKVSKQSWDKISLYRDNLFFNGWKNGKCYFYRFPGTLMLDAPFDEKKYIGLVGYEVVENLYHQGIISITVDSAISGSMPQATNRVVKIESPPDTFKVIYYIGFDQKTKATECYFDFHDRKFKKSPLYRKVTIGTEYMRDYVMVYTMQLGYNLVNMQGQRVFKYDFYDIVLAMNQYVIGKNKEGKFAVGDPASGLMSPFIFDTIQTIHGCDSTFNGTQVNPDGTNWYLIKLDGSYSLVDDKAKDCNGVEVPSAYKERPKTISIFNEKGKYGAKNELDSIVLQPEYELMYMYPHLRWFTAKKDRQYGIFHADGHWVFPLESRRVWCLNPSDSVGIFELQEGNYQMMFNERMEVLFEKPPVFFPISFFDWASVPSAIRPTDIDRSVTHPEHYQPYMGFYDGTYSHVFQSSGKYISSHKGKFQADVVYQGFGLSQKGNGLDIPIGMFVQDGQDYYVRLTDGFEYRK